MRAHLAALHAALPLTWQDIDWTKKTAFVLGNERDGVSEEAVAAADVCAVIEMVSCPPACTSSPCSFACRLLVEHATQQRHAPVHAHSHALAPRSSLPLQDGFVESFNISVAAALCM